MVNDMSRNFTYLFGPVPSRRFGRSLGVDLTPFKTCSLDCIFCQLGGTTCKTDRRREYVPADAVTAELETWLESGETADFITLAGSGEPTLHERFGEIIRFIRERTRIPVALLTNGTLLYQPEVRKQAANADVVKMTLTSWDQTSFERMHRPCDGVTFERLVEGERLFRGEFGGRLWLEVFLLDGINAESDQVKRLAETARLIRPDCIHLNTCVRPPAEAAARPVPEARLAELASLFSPAAEVIAEFKTEKPVAMQASEDAVFEMLRRRPCTAAQIADVFGMHLNELSKYLGSLVRTGRVQTVHRDRDIYYTVAEMDAHSRG